MATPMNEPRAVEARLDDAARACAQQGAQLTPLRRRVLGLILEAESPSTAYQLLDRLREFHDGATPPTIYRALYFLMEKRLIHKVESLNAFIPCIEAGQFNDAVQFLICVQCGTVTAIRDSNVSAALEQAAKRAGFRPGKAVVEIDGTCAACAVRHLARLD